MPPVVLKGVEWKVQLWIESQCLTIQMRLIDKGFEIFHLSCACAFKIFFSTFLIEVYHHHLGKRCELKSDSE